MMDGQTADRLKRARLYLRESDLIGDTKDNLDNLLDAAAAATNGTADKVEEKFAANALVMAVIAKFREGCGIPDDINGDPD